jgi:hypothetical protein
MINNARVEVKNAFSDKSKSIRVVRKPTKKASDFDKTLAQNGNEVIDLLSPDVLLVIHAPKGVDLRKCWLKVDSAVDLDISYSRSKSTWTFKIAPNNLNPNTPTTVNISAGDIQP